MEPTRESTYIQGEKDEVAIYLYLHNFTTVMELWTSHPPMNVHLKKKDFLARSL